MKQANQSLADAAFAKPPAGYIGGKRLLASRAEFERLCAVDPATLIDIQRAARFLYLQRLGFGGKVCSRVFGVNRGTGARFNISRIIPDLEALHERLTGVVIECLPYDRFIPRYDRDGALFYP